MLWKVRNWYKTCENLVHIASTIGELQHTKYLKTGVSRYFQIGDKPSFPRLDHMYILSCHAQSHVDIILLAIVVSLYSCCMIVELVYCHVHYWLCGKCYVISIRKRVGIVELGAVEGWIAR